MGLIKGKTRLENGAGGWNRVGKGNMSRQVVSRPGRLTSSAFLAPVGSALLFCRWRWNYGHGSHRTACPFMRIGDCLGTIDFNCPQNFALDNLADAMCRPLLLRHDSPRQNS